MQTFLPYQSFQESAKCLDRQRLGKQRVEVLQILQTLNGESKGWVNHPCVKMWLNDKIALIEYGLAVCAEWTKRGYKDTCEDKILKQMTEDEINAVWSSKTKAALGLYDPTSCLIMPDFMGNQKFHDSHKSNLLRKNPEHYSQFDWNVPDDLPYVWPVN